MIEDLTKNLLERREYLLEFMHSDEFAALKPAETGMLMVEVRQVTSLLETYNSI